MTKCLRFEIGRVSRMVTFSPTATDTSTKTNTPTPTPTPTNSSTATSTLTATATKTYTSTPTQTLTPTITNTSTLTPTTTSTFTPTLSPTITNTPTLTYTPTQTLTPTITFTITNTPTITSTPAPEVFYVSKNVITPSSGPVSIYVSYPNPGNYVMKIYNSAGEFIKNLSGNPVAGDTHSFSWDGTDTVGSPCASGLYIIYYLEPLHVHEARIVLLR